MRAGAMLIVLLPTLVAGCTIEAPVLEGRLPSRAPDLQPQGPLAGAGPPVDLNLSADAIALPAPPWQRGHAWKWSITGAQGSDSQEFVMYGETGTDYLLAATDPDDAMTQAFFGRSLPGRVNKQTLSGYDQGLGTRYMDFPLQTNKTWTLHVRGTDYMVRANFSRSVEGRGMGFAIDGASAFGERVSLTYVADAKWMGRFQLLDAAGQNIFQRALTAFTANYTGPYYTAKVDDLYVAVRNGTVPAPPLEAFAQGRAYSRLHLQIAAAGTGSVDLRLVDGQGQLRYNFSASGPGIDQQAEADLPSAAGQWHATWAVVGPVEVRLRLAGVDIEEGKV